MTELRYLCDTQRHLICVPYSIENLHRMAEELNIHRSWFHKGGERSGWIRNTRLPLPHYDIPKHCLAAVMQKCELVRSAEIVRIIRAAYPRQARQRNLFDGGLEYS